MTDRPPYALATTGMTVTLPPGWEAEIDQGAGRDTGGGITLSTPRLHAANFALPPTRGDFGSNAVERMVSGDALICLLEESPEVIGSALYSTEGIPQLSAADFSTTGMQRPIRGQSGTQAFFHQHGRAFALYVVVGSHLSRVNVIPEINTVLAGIVIPE